MKKQNGRTIDEKGEMLDKAILMATNGHHGQFDRGGKPYILHCLAVLHMVDSDDEEVQCIGIMHDLVEDTKTTYADLREAGFSDRVIEGVRAMTKNPGYSYEEYQQQVLANKDAVLVKMAGSVDLVADYNGRPAIIDYKTSIKIKRSEWNEDLLG